MRCTSEEKSNPSMKLQLLYMDFFSLRGHREFDASKQFLLQVLLTRCPTPAAEARNEGLAVPVSHQGNAPISLPHPFHWQYATIWNETGIQDVVQSLKYPQYKTFATKQTNHIQPKHNTCLIQTSIKYLFSCMPYY